MLNKLNSDHIRYQYEKFNDLITFTKLNYSKLETSF